MTGRYSFAREPRWVVGHVVVLALMGTMIGLGYWQLTVSEGKGFSLQNFGYALQWWAFTIFALGFWLRILRDHSRSLAAEPVVAPAAEAPAEPPVGYRRYVPPTAADISSDDEAQAAYNAYLAGLDQKGKA